MKFKDLKWEGNAVEGIQAWAKFVNGYEVSVIRSQFSYGGDEGLYEIGVYHGSSMCDPLGWKDTVKGWLTPEGVEKELELIEAL